jgi:antitoxin Phd
MARVWQLQEARNRLSEVIDEALRHGPQVITRPGKATAVLISCAEYRRMLRNQEKLSDFFRASALADADLDLTRDSSPDRNDFTP